MSRFYLLILVLLFLQCDKPRASYSGTNKFQRPAFQEIYQYQDGRNSRQLQLYLKHEDSLLRAAAAQAYGSVQDPLAAKALMALLQDPSISVREAAAYALGQLYDTTLQHMLMTRIEQEQQHSVNNRLLEALGKCSNSLGLSFLSSWEENHILEQSGVAWGLYRCGLKGLQSPEALNRVMSLLTSSSEQARLGAAHYLSRTRNLSLEAYTKAIQLASTDSLPEIRMALALALGKSGAAAQSTLVNLVNEDPDYRVRINAIRGLSAVQESLDKAVIFKALQDPHVLVALTAANFLKDFGDPSQTDTLRKLANEVPDIRVSASLLAASMRHSPDKSQLSAEVKARFSNSANPYHQAHYLEALSENPESHTLLKEILFGDYAPVVTTAAINGLLKIDEEKNIGDSLKLEFANSYQQAIETGDVALVGVAAQALRKPSLGYKDLFEDLGFLEEAMARLVLPRDMETYLELVQTSNYLNDEPSFSPIETIQNNPIKWERVQNIPRGQQVVISTDRGEITMEMLIEHSPATVTFILELMEQGFYDGKSFHRVVPNFVAQGGCPRGDGWGSTDLSLRSELGPLKYQTGSVGMASAGKDTESCQWFITHSPTPHLDGRYTIFAQVVRGMEVVHQLQVGDRIKEITILDAHEI